MTDRTTDELRDRLAELAGWVWRDRPGLTGVWVRGGSVVFNHPFPAGDLTALMAAWPEDEPLHIKYDPKIRQWTVRSMIWMDQRLGLYEAILPLTVAVLKAKAAEVKA